MSQAKSSSITASLGSSLRLKSSKSTAVEKQTSDASELKKCKWLSLSGAHLHLSTDDPTYFEIVMPATGTHNHLWAETAEARFGWVRAARFESVLRDSHLPLARASTSHLGWEALFTRLQRASSGEF